MLALTFENKMTLLNRAVGLILWARSGIIDDGEEDVAEAHDTVLDGLSDADFNNEVELINGRNLRDQITIEEAEDLYEESRLMHMGKRRN